MNNLKSDIKNNSFKTFYIFSGDESYLIDLYKNILIKKILTPKNSASFPGTPELTPKNSASFPGAPELTPKNQEFNLISFDGKTDVYKLIEAIDSVPFFSDYKVITVNNSDLLAKPNEALENFIQNASACTVIFTNEKYDRRSKLFKKIVAAGREVVFKTPRENELIKWIQDLFKDAGKTIGAKTTVTFLRRAGGANMQILYSEALKLIDYLGEKKSADISDIEEICVKSSSVRVFDLLDAAADKKIDTAIAIYEDLVFQKEPPLKILALLARQLRILMLCKELENRADAAKILGVPPFLVGDYFRRAKNFSHENLKRALKDCLRCDVDIKTGALADKLAVLLFIVKLTQFQ